MKIKLLICALLLMELGVYAQQQPTNTSPAGNANGRNDRRFWSRGGNTLAQGQNNIFGTRWNSPIYFMTSNVNRMRLMGSNFNFGINGYNGIDNSGFLFLGAEQNYMSNGLGAFAANGGAMSLLHLNGGEGGAIQDFGYRLWMKQGLTFTNNEDFGYLVFKKTKENKKGLFG
jgi:hypothetical protein